MRPRKLTLGAKASLAILLSAFANPMPVVFAAEDSPRASNEKFTRLDTNRDGSLSKSELRRFPDYGKAFDEADDNRDGKLDADEFIKAESIYQRQKVAAYVDDSIITAKVKAALVKEMKSVKVSVETHKGNVLLSGFVEDEAQVKKAMQAASTVDGVVSVKNGMAIR